MRAITKIDSKVDFLEKQIKDLQSRLTTMETLYYTSLDIGSIEHDYGIMDWLSSSDEETEDTVPIAEFDFGAGSLPDLNMECLDVDKEDLDKTVSYHSDSD